MSRGIEQAPLIAQEAVQEVSNEVREIRTAAKHTRSNNSAPLGRPYKIVAALLGLGLAACACIRVAYLGSQNVPGKVSPRGVTEEVQSEVLHKFKSPVTHASPQVHTYTFPKQSLHTFTFSGATHTFSTPIHTFGAPAKPKISTFSTPVEPKADNSDRKEGTHNKNKKLPWWKKNARPGEAWPSLFCWMHMELSELKLVKSQLMGKFGIFGCNDFAVVTRADKPIELGPHPKKANKSVMTWPNPMAPDIRGNPKLGDRTDSWKNANTFKVAWKTLTDSGAMWKHDWIVKIDPDTVFFADRLRYHVVNKTMPPEGPGRFFFLNCLFGDGRLYGAIEVFSVRAILDFKANGSKCDDLDAAVMGEDLFMEQCMRILQGSDSAVKDFKLVGDAHCTKAGCEDSWRVGFHPFPRVEDYWNCANTAVEAAAAKGM